jgi:guanylate kinase
MSKYKVIAICGKSASGKDTLLRYTIMNYMWLHKIINCTTRPPRENEVDGKNYHFLSLEEFAHKDTIEGKMIEVTKFREWYYGTSIEDLSLDEINIGVFNPAGIYALMQREDVDLYVVQVVASDKTRLLRSLTREDNPDVDEIVRRYLADKEDFEVFSTVYEPDYIIENDVQGISPGLVERAAREVVLYAQRHWAKEAN